MNTNQSSSSNSISSIPKLPPIEENMTSSPNIICTVSEEVAMPIVLRLNQVVEAGKHDVALITGRMVERARQEESQINSRFENITQSIVAIAEETIKERELELCLYKEKFYEAEKKLSELDHREKGLVSQQSKLSLELVAEKKNRKQFEKETEILKEANNAFRQKIDDILNEEMKENNSHLKEKGQFNQNIKTLKEENALLKLKNKEEIDAIVAEKDRNQNQMQEKHSKEAARLHQEVAKWKQKCEKTRETLETLQKEVTEREEKLKLERNAQEEKNKHTSLQHKAAVKALDEKIKEINFAKNEELANKNIQIEGLKNELVELKLKLEEVLRQNEYLKKTLRESEEEESCMIDEARLRLLRLQNKREKAKLDQDRKEANRKLPQKAI